MNVVTMALSGPEPKPCVAAHLPFIGVDIHNCIPPIPPAPEPHPVLWFIFGTTAPGCDKQVDDVLSPMGALVGRGHDAAFVFWHLWPNVLLPLIVLGSGSKTEFGVGSVRLKTGPCAVGEAIITGMQLHCNDVPPLPLPTGVNISALNLSVKAGLTWADIIASVVATTVDMAIGAAVQGLGNAIGGPVGNGTFGKAIGQAIVGTIVGLAMGTPIGYSTPFSPMSVFNSIISKGDSNADPIFDGVRGLVAGR